MDNKITDLESADRKKRIAVIETIQERRSFEDLHPLIDHLEREPERAIKEKIVMVLDDMLPEADAATVGRMIGAEDAFTRNCAVEAMKRAGDQVDPILATLANDANRDVRKFAIDALTTRDTPLIRQVLRERLSDSDPNVVYTAVDYLGSLKDMESSGAIELLALNSGDNPMLFCSCLESLAKIGTAACNKELIEYCNTVSEDPLFRYSILKYMGCCATYEAVETYILELVKRSSELFAKEIVDTMEAVCQREPEATINPQLKEVLKRLLNSVETGENKYELAKLLADNIDIEETLAIARLDLDSNKELVVMAAIEILGKFGEESDIDALEELAENTDSDDVLELIGDAVGKIADI